LFVYTSLALAAGAGAESLPANITAHAISRGKHFTVMETVRQNSGAGGSLVTNDFTIMGNGINRPDGTGGYVECKPVVMSYPEGLVCTGATYSVIIGADLRSGVVDFQSGDQQRIVFRPLGIAFHDRESGKSVWLASVKSCSAEVISNSVVFRDAFEGNGVEASLVYEYRAGRFSQSVIFSKSLAVSPEDFGMTAGRIELITEFLQSPAPTVTEHVLQSEQVSAKRAGMALIRL
jgi:hypothetical protein